MSSKIFLLTRLIFISVNLARETKCFCKVHVKKRRGEKNARRKIKLLARRTLNTIFSKLYFFWNDRHDSLSRPTDTKITKNFHHVLGSLKYDVSYYFFFKRTEDEKNRLSSFEVSSFRFTIFSHNISTS